MPNYHVLSCMTCATHWAFRCWPLREAPELVNPGFGGGARWGRAAGEDSAAGRRLQGAFPGNAGRLSGHDV